MQDPAVNRSCRSRVVLLDSRHPDLVEIERRAQALLTTQEKSHVG